MKKEIVSIYENIYNQELNWKNTLDNKFASRLTLVLSLVTATFIIFITLFFSNNKTVIENQKIILGCKFLSLASILCVVFALIAFYKCFFRSKLNYKVMPTVDIRMFHLFIHRNDLIGTKVEDDLFDYLNDCYQFCAYTNAAINTKREKALIVFDNVSSVTFIILVIVYILMIKSGYSIEWIF